MLHDLHSCQIGSPVRTTGLEKGLVSSESLRQTWRNLIYCVRGLSLIEKWYLLRYYEWRVALRNEGKMDFMILCFIASLNTTNRNYLPKNWSH